MTPPHVVEPPLNIAPRVEPPRHGALRDRTPSALNVEPHQISGDKVDAEAPDFRNVAGYDLVQMTPADFASAVYSGCSSLSLIGVGALQRPKRPTEVNPDGRPTPRYLFPVTAGEIDPVLFDVVDSSKPTPTFICYNTYLPSACQKLATGKRIIWKGKPEYFAAKNENIAELGALVIDLDVGRSKEEVERRRLPPGAALPVRDALDGALRMCREGTLPLPSMAVFSGRGVQLVWLLRQEAAALQQVENIVDKAGSADRRPVFCSETTLPKWKQVADELVRRLSRFGIDKGASKKPCNWFRFPGTVNEKSGATVTAWLIEELRYYGLDSLTGMLLLTSTREQSPRLYRDAEEAYRGSHSKRRSDSVRSAKPTRVVTPAQVAKPSKVRMIELEKINEFRGGLASGRYKFLYHYRSAVYRAHYPEHGHHVAGVVAAEKVEAVFKTFSQSAETPFPRGRMISACNADPWLIATNETVAEEVGVTREEVETLGLSAIVPSEVAEEREQARAARSREKKIKRDRLRLTVLVLLCNGFSYAKAAEATGVPKSSVRNMKKWMDANAGELLPDGSPLKEQEEQLIEQILEEYLGAHRRSHAVPA